MSAWPSIIAFASGLVAVPPEDACGPRTPASPQALVDSTPLIVRARAVRFGSGEAVDDPHAARVLDQLPRPSAFGPEERATLTEVEPLRLGESWGRVELEVLEVLKGREPRGARVATFGQTVVYAPRRSRRVPYVEPRPLTRADDCRPFGYRLGAEYLLFLSAERRVATTRAPVNEEVAGSEDAWVRWVRAAVRPRFFRPSVPRP